MPDEDHAVPAPEHTGKKLSERTKTHTKRVKVPPRPAPVKPISERTMRLLKGGIAFVIAVIAVVGAFQFVHSNGTCGGKPACVDPVNVAVISLKNDNGQVFTPDGSGDFDVPRGHYLVLECGAAPTGNVIPQEVIIDVNTHVKLDGSSTTALACAATTPANN